MEKEDKTKKTDWALIEDIAQDIYEDAFERSTRRDRIEIEKAIDNETANTFFRKEGGDMNVDATYISILTLGFTAIQTAISYVTFLFMIRRAEKASIPEDIVGALLEDKEFEQVIDDKVKNELINMRIKLNKKLKEKILKRT